MKRLSIALLFAVLTAAASGQPAVPAPPRLDAVAWFLMDADSGAVLAEHNADKSLPPASLTKMMTSYLLAEEIDQGRMDEQDTVLISENAWSQNPDFVGSSLMWIEPGMEVPLIDLQRGIIVSSGNDASVAVAEHIAGSEEVFAQLMNDAAARLGMQDSHFVNSHGLPHPQHRMTARDVATLSRAVIREHPEHYRIYAEKEFTFNNIRQYNRNTLMWEDPTVDGLKTGHTEAAGYCLAASARRDGMRLISVVMGTKSKRARQAETRSLLNYGFRFFETETVFEAMAELDTVRVWKGLGDSIPAGVLERTVLTLPRGVHQELQTHVDIDGDLVAPLAQGDRIGTVELRAAGETVHRVPLVALEAMEPGGFLARLWDTILMWIDSLFRT